MKPKFLTVIKCKFLKSLVLHEIMHFVQALRIEGPCSIVTPQLKFLNIQVQEKHDQSKSFQVLAVCFPKMQNQTEQCLCGFLLHLKQSNSKWIASHKTAVAVFGSNTCDWLFHRKLFLKLHILD